MGGKRSHRSKDSPKRDKPHKSKTHKDQARTPPTPEVIRNPTPGSSKTDDSSNNPTVVPPKIRSPRVVIFMDEHNELVYREAADNEIDLSAALKSMFDENMMEVDGDQVYEIPTNEWDDGYRRARATSTPNNSAGNVENDREVDGVTQQQNNQQQQQSAVRQGSTQ